ncbi:hypothetical protein ACSVIJ_07800 [Pseudomonas sp. NCHU5208]|uniref:hypothetical protein n=1 Tax=unclassified Pseudomonas TaxID=196821 RepID=UPI003F9A6934
MRYLTFLFLALLSTSTFAELASYCGQVERFRIWAAGSDTYGIWVEYKANPGACPSGFYLPHQSDNKSYVMSFLLAEKAQGNKICMQVVSSEVLYGRCKINYVYNP